MTGFAHGLNGYSHRGCRCDVCRGAATTYQREWRDARLAERVMRDGRWFSPTALRHGNYAVYVRYGCRCNPCTAANTTHHRGWRARQAR